MKPHFWNYYDGQKKSKNEENRKPEPLQMALICGKNRKHLADTLSALHCTYILCFSTEGNIFSLNFDAYLLGIDFF